MKRIRLEVSPSKSRKLWSVTGLGGDRLYVADTQTEAIELARLYIRTGMKAGYTFTLKIKRPDGTIREERTYPRSSDPRRTKG